MKNVTWTVYSKYFLCYVFSRARNIPAISPSNDIIIYRTMSDMALLHISCLQLESSHIHYLQTYGFLTIIYYFYDERCLTEFSLKIHGIRYNT